MQICAEVFVQSC